MKILRGDIFLVSLSPVIGSEQGGERPCLVIQNNTGNRFSNTIIVASISAKHNKTKLPTHIEIKAGNYGLDKDSLVMLEQVRTVDIKRLKHKIAHVDDTFMKKVNRALKISFSL